MRRRSPRIGAAAATALVAFSLGQAAQASPTFLPYGQLSKFGQPAFLPQVVLDPEGTAVVVWYRYDGLDAHVQAAVRPAGGDFAPASDISEPNEDGDRPQVALDSQGNALAVWSGTSGGVAGIQASTRPAGGPFAPAATISNSSPFDYFQIAVNPQGSAVAVWVGLDGADYRAQAAFKPAGGVFEPAVSISDAGQVPYGIQVALDQHGNAVAVWFRSDGSNDRIQAAFRPAGGAFEPAVDISAVGENAAIPQAAIDAQGNAAVVWRADGSDPGIRAAFRPAGGVFQPAVSLSGAGGGDAPQVAFDPQGNALAVWRSARIQAAFRPVGGVFEPALNVSDPGLGDYVPQVSFDPQGNAVVVWEHYESGYGRIQAAVRPAGGAFGPVVNVSGLNASNPQIALDHAGNGIVVWHGNDPTDSVIQAAGYDAAGPLLRDLRIPASGKTGSALSFSVSPFDVWSAVPSVQWDFGDGGKATGKSVKHTYRDPARPLSITLTATDSVGNATTTTRAIRIADGTRPVVSSFSIDSAFAAGSQPTAKVGKRKRRVKLGGRFRYRISEQATVRITIERRTVKRRRGGKRRIRYVSVGTLTRRNQKAGSRRLAFSGRLGRRALRAGRYRAMIRATDAAGNRSSARRDSFRILRR